jgi:hypothetical protein
MIPLISTTLGGQRGHLTGQRSDKTLGADDLLVAVEAALLSRAGTHALQVASSR